VSHWWSKPSIHHVWMCPSIYRFCSHHSRPGQLRLRRTLLGERRVYCTLRKLRRVEVTNYCTSASGLLLYVTRRFACNDLLRLVPDVLLRVLLTCLKHTPSSRVLDGSVSMCVADRLFPNDWVILIQLSELFVSVDLFVSHTMQHWSTFHGKPKLIFCILVTYLMRISRGSSVSIVSGYGLDDRAIEVWSPAEVKWLFLYPLCPDRLWGPPSLLSNGYGGSFPRG
jgi:hypothetical protein